VERELSKGEEHLRNNLHPEPITGSPPWIPRLAPLVCFTLSCSPDPPCCARLSAVPEGYSYAGPGSKYARNPPVPPEVTIVYDWNRGQGYIPDTSSDSSR
jgi:hypothetical protein